MGASPGIEPPEGYVLNTEEGRQRLALFGSLTTVRSWRLSGQPFPVVVLDATEPQADVGAYVDALEQAAAEARVPHISPALDTDAEDAELTLLGTMSEPIAWRSARPTSPADEWNAPASSIGPASEQSTGLVVHDRRDRLWRLRAGPGRPGAAGGSARRGRSIACRTPAGRRIADTPILAARRHAAGIRHAIPLVRRFLVLRRARR